MAYTLSPNPLSPVPLWRQRVGDLYHGPGGDARSLRRSLQRSVVCRAIVHMPILYVVMGGHGNAGCDVSLGGDSDPCWQKPAVARRGGSKASVSTTPQRKLLGLASEWSRARSLCVSLTHARAPSPTCGSSELAAVSAPPLSRLSLALSPQNRRVAAAGERGCGVHTAFLYNTSSCRGSSVGPTSYAPKIAHPTRLHRASPR